MRDSPSFSDIPILTRSVAFLGLLGAVALLWAPDVLRAQDDAGGSSVDSGGVELAHLEAKRAIAAEICEGADRVAVSEYGLRCTQPYKSPVDDYYEDSPNPTMLDFYFELFSSSDQREVLVGVTSSNMGGTPVLYRNRTLLFRETSEGWRQLDSVHLDVRNCQSVASESGESVLICTSNRQVKMNVAARVTAVRVEGDDIEVNELVGFGHERCHGTHHCRPGDFSSGRAELAEEASSLEADPPVVAARVEAEYVVEEDGCDPDAPNCAAYHASFMKKDGSRRHEDFRKKSVTLLLRYEVTGGRPELIEKDRSKVEIFEGESAPPSY